MKYFVITLIILFSGCSSFNKTSSNFRKTSSYIGETCAESLRAVLNHTSIHKNITLWHLFKRNDVEINKKYSSHSSFKNLSRDPDHNFEQTTTSKLEAVSGIYAHEIGILPGLIVRGPHGTEFIDGKGIPWDVKTPISPLEEHDWSFDPNRAGLSVLHKLEKMSNIKVLVDLSYTTPEHTADLKKWIRENIPEIMRARIKYVIVPDALSL